MLRNKGTSPLTLKWNGREAEVQPGEKFDVKQLGVVAPKDISFLEERFIAKYPESIERFLETAAAETAAPVKEEPASPVKDKKKKTGKK